MQASMDKREHNRALDVLWEIVNRLNQFVNDSEPWKLKNDPEAFRKVIYQCLYGIQKTSELLAPFLPDTSETALSYIGVRPQKFRLNDFGKVTYTLTTPEALFPKIERIKS
jgi:methionyl-tRNA synthetase